MVENPVVVIDTSDVTKYLSVLEAPLYAVQENRVKLTVNDKEITPKNLIRVFSREDMV